MAKDKYTTHVKPFLVQIKELKSHGATERQIANKLNISYASFNNFKQDVEVLVPDEDGTIEIWGKKYRKEII